MALAGAGAPAARAGQVGRRGAERPAAGRPHRQLSLTTNQRNSPEHAGEVRVVESNHLRAVAPPRGPRQILPLCSCEVVPGEAQP